MHFEGKLLVINTINDGGAVIENPKIEEIEGRKFIAGTSVGSDGERIRWTAGSKIWVALETIVTITEAADAEEWRHRLRLHRD